MGHDWGTLGVFIHNLGLWTPPWKSYRAGKIMRCGGITACRPKISDWRRAGSTEGWSLGCP